MPEVPPDVLLGAPSELSSTLVFLMVAPMRGLDARDDVAMVRGASSLVSEEISLSKAKFGAKFMAYSMFEKQPLTTPCHWLTFAHAYSVGPRLCLLNPNGARKLHKYIYKAYRVSKYLNYTSMTIDHIGISAGI